MIYLDNSATTALSKTAKAAMLEVMENNFGNPSSLHRVGLDAEHAMEAARASILRSLGLRPPYKKTSLIFTSGGSESNNLAILGAAYAKKRRSAPKIITTEGEHSSVEECVKHLEETGWEVCRIRTVGGKLDMEQLRAALTPNTAIVSIMAVNNETGAVYDTKAAMSLAKAVCPDAVTHVDAVQAYAKLAPAKYMASADLVSISSHKIHGPKGVGALYVSPDILKARKLSPIILGGGQESALRSGTENTIGISGFGAAAEAMSANLSANTEKLTSLREHLKDKLEFCSESYGIKLNIPEKAAPHILSFALSGIRSETMLHYLEQYGIYVSSGSACSSNSKSKLSRALTAFGVNACDAECSLRVSLCAENTTDEIDTFTERLCQGIKALAKSK